MTKFSSCHIYYEPCLPGEKQRGLIIELKSSQKEQVEVYRQSQAVSEKSVCCVV